MQLSITRRYFSVAMALLVLSVALVSRVPTSKCRCHERRSPAKQQQSAPCVFGQLRTLAASIVIPTGTDAVLLVEFNPFHDIGALDLSPRVLTGRIIAANARAPPSRVDRFHRI